MSAEQPSRPPQPQPLTAEQRMAMRVARARARRAGIANEMLNSLRALEEHQAAERVADQVAARVRLDATADTDARTERTDTKGADRG